MTEVRWMKVAERFPRFYHTTSACFGQLPEYDEDNEGAARGLGMSKCPDCERKERLNAVVESGQPSLRTGG